MTDAKTDTFPRLGSMLDNAIKKEKETQKQKAEQERLRRNQEERQAQINESTEANTPQAPGPRRNMNEFNTTNR